MKIGTKRLGIATALFAAVILCAPAPAFAANATFLGPIVPAECKCDNQAVQNADGSAAGQTVTTAPDYGCVLQVVQNSVNFGITLATILFTIYLVITGFAFMTSGGSGEARSKAKTRFMNVFIGLAVLLCAWLLVDYVMKTVYNQDSVFGPWNAILAGQADKSDRCIVAKNPSAVTTGSVNIVTGGNGTGVFTSSGDANARICSAASAYQGASTAAGPAGGNLACAWAVNNVVRAAGYSSIGGNNVQGMENALRGGRGTQVSQAQAACGDIVIEAGDSHVGICMNAGCTQVISNSSSKAKFSWISSINFEPSYHSGNGRIYRVTN